MILDIGTGDGRFAYESARQHPKKFFIGIDANAHALEKISRKATRKPAKGGLPNVLFLRAAIEDLPAELNDTASEIHIHFPWGSLMRAIVLCEERALGALRRISSDGCLLEVIVGFDPSRDRAELERLGLSSVSLRYFRQELPAMLAAHGFRIRKIASLAQDKWPHSQTSWARRLGTNKERQVVYFTAQARK